MSPTRGYPAVPPDLPPRSRGVIGLLEENCTSCMLCARECPDWCIHIESHTEPGPGAGRGRTRPVLDRFAIDYSLCMYCGICVEVCPFDALFWSPEFEYAEHDAHDLVHERDRLREWTWTVPPPPALDPAGEPPRELTPGVEGGRDRAGRGAGRRGAAGSAPAAGRGGVPASARRGGVPGGGGGSAGRPAATGGAAAAAGGPVPGVAATAVPDGGARLEGRGPVPGGRAQPSARQPVPGGGPQPGDSPGRPVEPDVAAAAQGDAQGEGEPGSGPRR